MRGPRRNAVWPRPRRRARTCRRAGRRNPDGRGANSTASISPPDTAGASKASAPMRSEPRAVETPLVVQGREHSMNASADLTCEACASLILGAVGHGRSSRVCLPGRRVERADARVHPADRSRTRRRPRRRLVRGGACAHGALRARPAAHPWRYSVSVNDRTMITNVAAARLVDEADHVMFCGNGRAKRSRAASPRPRNSACRPESP